MMNHPYPLIAWDVAWSWQKVVAAILWNALLVGALTFAVILGVLSVMT